MVQCGCGNEWKKQKNLSTYEGETVLVCMGCHERYYNAQEFFMRKELDELKEAHELQTKTFK